MALKPLKPSKQRRKDRKAPAQHSSKPCSGARPTSWR